MLRRAPRGTIGAAITENVFGQTGEASHVSDCTWDRASKRVVCATFGRVVVHPFDHRNPP